MANDVYIGPLMQRITHRALWDARDERKNGSLRDYVKAINRSLAKRSSTYSDELLIRDAVAVH